LNRDFEQVLADLAKLQELASSSTIASPFSYHGPGDASLGHMVVAELLQCGKKPTWAGSAVLHRRWEKKREDPNDALLEAKALIEKRRKTAARKKSTGSKG